MRRGLSFGLIASTAAVASIAMLPATASAGCFRPQTTALKSLAAGKTDTVSFFTLTKGRAVIEVDLRDIPDRCRRGGISVSVVSKQTGRPVTCGGPDSELGPAHYLRCRVNVLGGLYSVRVKNPTACKVTYTNICANN